MSQPLFVIVSDDESGGGNSVHTAVLDDMGNQKVVALSEANQFRQIPKEPLFAVYPPAGFGVSLRRKRWSTLRLKCDLCEEKFAKPYLLRNHRVRVHDVSVEEKPVKSGKGTSGTGQPLTEEDAPNDEDVRGPTAEEARIAKLEQLVVKDSLTASKIAQELDSLKKTEPKRPRYVCRKKYPCAVCGKPFASPSLLERHGSVHTRERLYPCPHCPKRCAYTDERLRHIRRAHPELCGGGAGKGVPPGARYRCSTCGGKTFSTKYRYKEHLRVHLQGLFACHLCSKKYAKRDNLVRHLLTHSGERNHACHICQKRFLDAVSLRSHLQTHTGEYRYTCGVCQKGFSKKRSLYRHLQVHGNEEAGQAYGCKVCWERFGSGPERDAHERLHTVGDPGGRGRGNNTDTPQRMASGAASPRDPESPELSRTTAPEHAGNVTAAQLCVHTSSQSESPRIPGAMVTGGTMPSPELSRTTALEHAGNVSATQLRVHASSQSESSRIPSAMATGGTTPSPDGRSCDTSFRSAEGIQLHTRLPQPVPRTSQTDPNSFACSNAAVPRSAAGRTMSEFSDR